MSDSAKIVFSTGIIMLLFTIVNSLSIDIVSPSTLRAEVIASLSSICLIAVSLIWKEVKAKKPNSIILKGDQGIFISNLINDEIKKELGWGSQLILTASAAATILVYWDNSIILRRGIITNSNFIPGDICMKARSRNELISLVNTRFFPGRYEFDPIVENLPSILVYPLNNNGWVIIGGLSERSFTKADEKWIVGWSDKLCEMLCM